MPSFRRDSAHVWCSWIHCVVILCGSSRMNGMNGNNGNRSRRNGNNGRARASMMEENEQEPPRRPVRASVKASMNRAAALAAVMAANREAKKAKKAASKSAMAVNQSSGPISRSRKAKGVSNKAKAPYSRKANAKPNAQSNVVINRNLNNALRSMNAFSLTSRANRGINNALGAFGQFSLASHAPWGHSSNPSGAQASSSFAASYPSSAASSSQSARPFVNPITSRNFEAALLASGQEANAARTALRANSYRRGVETRRQRRMESIASKMQNVDAQQAEVDTLARQAFKHDELMRATENLEQAKQRLANARATAEREAQMEAHAELQRTLYNSNNNGSARANSSASAASSASSANFFRSFKP